MRMLLLKTFMKFWGLNPPNFCQASKVNLRMSKKAGNKQAFDFVTIPYLEPPHGVNWNRLSGKTYDN